MKITIEESPYGDSGKEYNGMLGMIEHYILQLKSFREQPGKTEEDKKNLDMDIEGYMLLLYSKSEENATTFLEIKHKAKRTGNLRFRNNLEVLDYMKANGIWK